MNLWSCIKSIGNSVYGVYWPHVTAVLSAAGILFATKCNIDCSVWVEC